MACGHDLGTTTEEGIRSGDRVLCALRETQGYCQLRVAAGHCEGPRASGALGPGSMPVRAAARSAGAAGAVPSVLGSQGGGF
jgi:hypothetical protein